MSDIDVRAYLDQLRSMLPYVPPLPTAAIKKLHKKRDFGGIVQLIRKTMNVGAHLTVHWTSAGPPSGIPDAGAWIGLPNNMPYYGTPDFKTTKLDVFVLKSFRDASTFEEFAMIVAHELSHVVLDSIHHPLRRDEKAVDLTAMLLGFSNVYRNAAHSVRWLDHSHFERRQVGYLSSKELDKACKILLPASVRTKRAAFYYLRATAGLLILLALVLSSWAASMLSTYWELHRTVLQQHEELRRQIPLRFDEFRTLVDARAGLTTLTRIYKLAVTPGDPMTAEQIAELRIIVHREVCATYGADVGKGISYVNEYLDAHANFIASFETASCP